MVENVAHVTKIVFDIFQKGTPNLITRSFGNYKKDTESKMK